MTDQREEERLFKPEHYDLPRSERIAAIKRCQDTLKDAGPLWNMLREMLDRELEKGKAR
jgi:hypothetical protein